MRRFAVCALMVALAACSSEKPKSTPSKEPVSVRGWIEDVAGSPHETNPDMEAARRGQIFQATSVWVENVDYVSGGVAENGSFILLDVPPGNVTIGFDAPGAEQARVVLQNIPGNADVFIPGLILKKGGAAVAKPEDVKVRVPARIDKERPTGKTAIVGGVSVPITDVPLAAMIDRHDYPKPGGFRPVAIFK
ncbi:MAG TPA: hypothetical protein VLV78_14585 [Thermoanaerobaculia bacterium]|nr:hypothetical protein [Thermoanaerobaculia bacterium]